MNLLNNFKSIKTRILIPIVGIVVFGNLISSSIFIYTNYEHTKENIIQKAHISLKPIILNSTISVAGANIMKLKSSNAKGLYNISEALAIVINGKSDNRKKSLFSPALPPQKIQYKYIKQDNTLNINMIYKKYQKYNNISIFDGSLLIIKEKLNISNGGEVFAIFDASLKEKILYKTILMSILTFLFIVFISVLIIFLISNAIIKDVSKLKSGLLSYFLFLKKENIEVLPISLNSNDELNNMANLINDNISTSIKLHDDIDSLIQIMDKNIITSKTDEKGILIHVSSAFCDICEYTKDELIGKSHSILRSGKMDSMVFRNLWETLKNKKIWRGEIKNKTKNGTYYWVETIITPNITVGDVVDGYTAIHHNITSKKEIEVLSENLEKTIKERTKELDDEKELIKSIMNSQENIVITSDGKTFQSVNNAFLKFFNIKTIEEFIDIYGYCICDAFKEDKTGKYIQKQIDGLAWQKYIEQFPNKIHKVIMQKDSKEYIFTITTDKFNFANKDLLTVVFSDITIIEESKEEIELIHKHTRDSIEYASHIQNALIPDEKLLNKYFKDMFVYWEPKDTVGGDIWLFNELRHEDECLLFFIDCTGHGVPGAFVTMIVKSIEREIVSKIIKHPEFDISPATIMGYFNNTMKRLLHQETKDSISNAGWDGGIIYYNKRTQILKFAGAETSLFYTNLDGELNIIKGNRYSVGYKKCQFDYEYKDHILEVQEGMKFYCTTDGYIDQNGGKKDFPFGKKNFSKIIKTNYSKSLRTQKQIFIHELLEYQDDNDRNDDITLISFEIGAKSENQENTKEEIIKYEGLINQSVITTCLDNVEAKINNIGVQGIISTIIIEYCQNMMNYSKGIRDHDENNIVSIGSIKLTKNGNKYYEIISSNIVSQEDKDKIEPKLFEIKNMDKKEIKKRYRELRKSGEHTHEKGGGIGVYEIAKISDEIIYEFVLVKNNKYNFTMKSKVNIKS